MFKKSRRRKLQHYYTKATSYHQCQHNSAGWIEPDGKIHWMPMLESSGSKEKYPMDHSEYILSRLFNGDNSKYFNWNKEQRDYWVKVSNMFEMSIGKGMPNEKQLSSFGEMHIECIKSVGAYGYDPESTTIEIFNNRSTSSKPILEEFSADFFEKYAPKLYNDFWKALGEDSEGQYFGPDDLI